MRYLLLLGLVAFSAASATEEENPCECPRSLHRVCGSDGNTYSNPCMLNCAKHEKNPDLVQVHEGPCDEHDHDFEDTCQCDNTFEPVCGDDHITYMNLCNLECAAFTTSPGVEIAYEGKCHAETVNAMEIPFEFEDKCQCDDTFIPVCGDDEITYNNLCHLECAAITTKPGVEVKHEGVCHPEIKKKQQILKSCACQNIFKPVCGNDGLTYSNLCVLKCQTSTNPGLELAHPGKCTADEAKDRNACDCFRNFNPVCGTNGKTYGNPCVLCCAAATKVPGLKVLHIGWCPKDQVHCVCPFIYKPVCGNDGDTYPSECILKCAKLAFKPDLEVAHQGVCKHTLQAAQKEETQEIKKLCGCPYIWEPVCGNNGRTYPNECTLKCDKWPLQPDLEVAHHGVCKNGLQAAHEEEVEETKKPCVCPYIWKPVCGNDGVTYPNECILKCVKLVLKPDLEVAYQGACKHVQQSLQEAEEKKIEEWRAIEEFKQKVEKFVEDPCICPKIWRPVCGSDVRTYANECTLNCARSRGNPKLWLVHRTLCEYIPLKELRKSKCACNTNSLPVCGNDGKTYRNPCELYCSAIFKKSGLDLAEYGPCTNV